LRIFQASYRINRTHVPGIDLSVEREDRYTRSERPDNISHHTHEQTDSHNMIELTSSLKAWNTAAFADVLKQEVTSLGINSLPLQQGLKYSSVALADKLSVSILNTSEDDDSIFANASLFYTGIIPGCSCADDPTPIDESNEYCEISICINKTTAEASIALVE
jgi:hypothetical protein